VSDASYVTQHLHESQIAINKCASRLVALAFFFIFLAPFYEHLNGNTVIVTFQCPLLLTKWFSLIIEMLVRRHKCSIIRKSQYIFYQQVSPYVLLNWAAEQAGVENKPFGDPFIKFRS